MGTPTPTPSVRSVYLTFPDLDTARALARRLLERRLIACANLLPGALSVYRWEGEVQEEAEVVAFCKTTEARLAELVRVVEEHHPYDTPCVVVLPVEAGSLPYLAWVEREADGAG